MTTRVVLIIWISLSFSLRFWSFAPFHWVYHSNFMDPDFSNQPIKLRPRFYSKGEFRTSLNSEDRFRWEKFFFQVKGVLIPDDPLWLVRSFSACWRCRRPPHFVVRRLFCFHFLSSEVGLLGGMVRLQTFFERAPWLPFVYQSGGRFEQFFLPKITPLSFRERNDSRRVPASKKAR